MKGLKVSNKWGPISISPIVNASRVLWDMSYIVIVKIIIFSKPRNFGVVEERALSDPKTRVRIPPPPNQKEFLILPKMCPSQP